MEGRPDRPRVDGRRASVKEAGAERRRWSAARTRAVAARALGVFEEKTASLLTLEGAHLRSRATSGG